MKITTEERVARQTDENRSRHQPATVNSSAEGIRFDLSVIVSIFESIFFGIFKLTVKLDSLVAASMDRLLMTGISRDAGGASRDAGTCF